MTNGFVKLRHARWPLALALSIALLGCGQQRQPAYGPPQVGVVTLKATRVPLTTELPARTSPYLTSNVEPQVTGILKSILFTQGSLVRAGQPLYQIDPRPFQAAFDQASGQLSKDEATLAKDKIDLGRYAALWKQRAISQQTYQDQIGTVGVDSGTVEADKAAVEAARINLDWTQVTAPITGIVGRSLITPGALVTANQTSALAVIQTLDPIYVDMNQSSAELVQLENSATAGNLSRSRSVTARVTLDLDDGTHYSHDGTLQFSEVTVDPTTGAVVLRAIFPNPDGLLLPGMYVRATIIEGVATHAILAPQRGITRDEKGQPTAFVVDNHGIARLRTLQASRAVGNEWLVTEGLNDGDRLVVDGLQKVQVDKPVHAVPFTQPSGRGG